MNFIQWYNRFKLEVKTYQVKHKIGLNGVMNCKYYKPKLLLDFLW